LIDSHEIHQESRLHNKKLQNRKQYLYEKVVVVVVVVVTMSASGIVGEGTRGRQLLNGQSSVNLGLSDFLVGKCSFENTKFEN